MRSVLWVVGLIAIAGCEKKSVEKLYEGPMPVTFGDCAGAGVAWVSGPRPLAFTPADAENAWVAADGSSLAAATDKPPTTAPTTPVDPQLARERAIDAARNGGVLGSVTAMEGGAFASLIDTGDISSGLEDSAIYDGLLGRDIGEMQGGFGFGMRGTGPSNGGPNWGTIGTIGTGRYGVIGHGSGTGVGYSPGGGYVFRHGRVATEPSTIMLGQVVTQGDLDKAIIRRYIKRNVNKLRYCYEKQLLVNPKLGGNITAKFFITPNGEVATSQVEGIESTVAGCIAGVIKGITFPKPPGGGAVQVQYPMTLTSPYPQATANASKQPPSAAGNADGRAAGRAAGSAEGSAAGSADAGSDSAPAAGSADAGSGSAATTAAGGARGPGSKRRLFRAKDLQAPAYQPGALNPLRPERAAVESCFRKGATHAGTAVFELAYDASGTVQRASIHGVDDKKVEACLVAVAKKVKSVGATGAERCSVAYGTMPLASLPSLDITADAILLGTTKLTTTSAVLGESLPGHVKAITDALDAKMKEVTAASSPVLSQHGPLVIKPIDTTKMKLVTRTIASALASGNDFVLAAQTGTEWSLLAPMPLPIVPVPFGTGGTWTNVKVPASVFATTDAPAADARSVLSIHVRKDTIALAQTKSDYNLSFPRDADAAKTLADELKKRRATPELANRDDVEIAIDSDLTYADYVAVVRTAIAAGFTRWRFTEPRSLAAPPKD